MRLSSLFQILIIFLIFASITFVYLKFFKKQNFVEVENKEVIEREISAIKEMEDEKSLIINLEYKSFDAQGNKYIIKSKSAKKTNEKNEILELEDVSAIIYLKGKSPIYILSDFAIYDKQTLNTKFFNNVEINHDDIDVESENLDLLYEDKFVSLYNITKAKNDNLELIADKIEYNLLTKDLSINMYSSNNKIKINHY
tara:strand:- start:2757 stop:3350 length:594 start_codon:yes stop_codon:yes gene_type:complete